LRKVLPGSILQFGDFELDCGRFELLRNGQFVRVERKPMELLVLLVTREGAIVPRAEIAERLWSSEVFVDTEHGINTAVRKLRHVLRDDPDRPRFIQTATGMGYRFIAPTAVIEPIVSAVSEPSPAEQPPIATPTPEPATTEPAAPSLPAQPAKRPLAVQIGIAALLVLTVAFILLAMGPHKIVAWRLTRNPSSLASIEVVPLVALHGFQGYPAFSPDGNQVAFEEDEDKASAIYTTLVGGDKPLRVTAKSDVCCATWSPDNRQIAFMRFLKDGFTINVIPALGGTERTLYTAGSGIRGWCPRLDWSPDGKLLVFSEPRSMLNPRVALISLDDLSVRPLTSPAQQEYDCEPAFSPDGSRVAFERGSVGGHSRDTFVTPITGGGPRRLTFDNSWGGSPAWTQDGSEIIFSSNRGGPMNLWRISANGGSPQPVAGVSAPARAPSIPKKGNLLAYEHAARTTGIWRISLMDQTHSAGHPTSVTLARGMINTRPSISPDGKKVVFESDRMGFSDIWYCDTGDSNCRQLTSLHGTAGTARWSPDGQRVAFEFQSQHYYDVYVLEVPDGRPLRLVTFPEADNGAPNWSRDGKWIYFYSSHEKGPLQLWKVPFQGGQPVRVTRNGGVYAAESNDGRFLYFSKMEQPGIWRISLDGGEEERVLDQPEGWRWYNWALAPGGIYFVSQADNERSKIEFFDFTTRQRSLIANVDKLGFGLALAPDGKSLLYSRTESEDYEIMLIKNFH
jgi:Tol biopolymer transport system component/DNA-binding winged helix-turn-helix (wHTH) protein